MDRIEQAMVLISVFSKVAALVQYSFTRQSSLSGQIPSNTSPIPARSLLDCAAMCNVINKCEGIFHSATRRECFLDANGHLSSNLLQDESTSYFMMEADSGHLATTTPSPASPTIVSTTACPVSFTENILLLGSSGNNHTFKIIHALVTQEVAVSVCTGFDLQLIRTNDADKINDLANLLDACNVYNATGYWTDAQRQVDEKDQPWRNSDGSTMSASVWCNGKPGFHSSEDCARLAGNCDFKLKDTSCSARFCIICE